MLLFIALGDLARRAELVLMKLSVLHPEIVLQAMLVAWEVQRMLQQAMGVFSANEFLTRSNLMKAFDENSRTPID